MGVLDQSAEERGSLDQGLWMRWGAALYCSVQESREVGQMSAEGIQNRDQTLFDPKTNAVVFLAHLPFGAQVVKFKPGGARADVRAGEFDAH
jgi:hypothetical protein